VRRLYGLIAVILVLGLLVSCGSRLPGPRTIILGPRVASVTTPSGLNAGDSFTFVATVSGSPIITWSWNFDGGATPNTSTAMSPTVVLVNPSTTDSADYNASVTVADADGRSYTYNFTFTVGETLNQAPVFVGLPASITGNFTFSINDADGDDVTIALTLVSGDVTVSPLTIAATSANYGPFDISVSNAGVEDQDVTIDIALNDGHHDDVVDTVTGTVAGVVLDPDTIYMVPSADTVNAGDTLRVVVYAGAIANQLLVLNSVTFNYGGTDDTRANYQDWLLTVDPDSWNLGAPGGATWEKDGAFWNAWTPNPMDVGSFTRLFSWNDMAPDPPEKLDTPWENVSVNVSPVVQVGGAPAGTAGPLFNIQFTANAAGDVDFTFVEADTYYADADEVQHSFGHYVGATVTIN